jgi:hypothetical protein
MKWSLFAVPLVLAGCNLKAYVGNSIGLRYTPTTAPVCTKFSLISMNDILVDAPVAPYSGQDSGGVVGKPNTEAPPWRPVELPTPTSKAWYTVGISGYGGDTYPIDLEIRCLPGKPAVRKKFGYTMSANLVTISITENPNKPEGIDVDVLLGYGYRDENPVLPGSK